MILTSLQASHIQWCCIDPFHEGSNLSEYVIHIDVLNRSSESFMCFNLSAHLSCMCPLQWYAFDQLFRTSNPFKILDKYNFWHTSFSRNINFDENAIFQMATFAQLSAPPLLTMPAKTPLTISAPPLSPWYQSFTTKKSSSYLFTCETKI